MRKNITIKATQSTFKTYGLKASNNFLEAPKCECGCGSYANLVLETNEDLYNFIGAMLEENDCDYCGIFARKMDNTIVMGLKLDGEIRLYSAPNENVCKAKEFVAWAQKDLQLHCYGLLEQVDDALYKIVMK